MRIVDKFYHLWYTIIMEEKVVDITEYIELHKNGIPISKVRTIDNQTFHVLRDCGIDVRIIDRDKNLTRLYSMGSLMTFSKDTKEYSHRFFYSIPLQTVSGTIVGFIYRTVFDKSYTTITRTFKDKDHKVPIMFGFYKDFENYDENETCKPIIVCEGLKDCITLKKIYPYVLSNNTSHMGINLQVLSNLTNKFILIYDNDKAGEDGTAMDISNVQKMKYDVIEMNISDGYKDITDLSENPERFKRLKDSLLHHIEQLEKGTSGMDNVGRSSIRRR